MDLPDWLQNLLSPIKPSGVDSINRSENSQLQELEDPGFGARLQALTELERTGGTPPRPGSTPPMAPPASPPPEQQRVFDIAERLRKRQETLDSIR
jgi:hypothetical protein